MLPASGFLDGFPPPYPRRAVEVKEHTAAGASGVLEHEVAIKKNSFHLRQKRVIPVDVRPPRLHHTGFRIGEVMNGTQQKVFWGRKVGVEDGDELSLGGIHAFSQRSRFEAFAVGAVMVGDGVAQRGIAFDQVSRHVHGLVG